MRSRSLLKLITSLALIVLFSTAIRAQSWTMVSTMSPNPRMLESAVEVNGKLYIVGGVVPNTTTVEQRIDVFDPQVKTWKALEPTGLLPKGFGGATWAHEGKIYRYVPSSIYVYDPKTNTWEAPIIGGELPSIPLNIKPVLVGAKAFFLGDHTSGSPNLELPYLEMTDLSWGQLSTSGVAKAGYSPAAWSDGNSIFMFQGQASELTSDVSILDLATNTWRIQATGLYPFYANAIIAHEGKLVLLVHDGKSGSTLKTLEFDLASKELRELSLTRDIAQVHSKAMLKVGGTLYSVGHMLDESKERMSDTIMIESLTLPSSVAKRDDRQLFRVSPNPVVKQLHLSCSRMPTIVKIIDMGGREVMTVAGSTIVDVSSLPPGAYAVGCYVEGEWIEQKFLKTDQ